MGAALGYDPHLYFDTSYYLEQHPEIARAGQNPLVHYVLEGERKGYVPHPAYFDPELYRQAAGIGPGQPLLAHFVKNSVPDPTMSSFNYLNTDRFREQCKASASRWGVPWEVAPTDMTMGYGVFHEANAGRPERAVEHYFVDGDRSARLLGDLIYDRIGLSRDDDLALLEFASGYGRVTRHWRRHITAKVTTCDIYPAAVEFNTRVLGVDSQQSSTSPEALRLPRRYDVIFCLSFFTHMPLRTWERWFKRLFAYLAPGGHLIFTTHGRTSTDGRGSRLPLVDYISLPRPSNTTWTLPTTVTRLWTSSSCATS